MTQTILTYGASNHGRFKVIYDCLGVKLVNVSSVKVARQIKQFDGLLLQGGSDIAPEYYGEKNRSSYMIDDGRDVTEWTLVRRALMENIPILGICRGMQMTAVACGGALWQDMKEDKVSSLNHRAYHWLTAVANPLRQYIPNMKVNSRHHQAIRTVPYGMKVLAKSPDGVVEAIWRPGVLGVQWHPEDMFADDHRWAGLFRWHVNGLQ